MRPKTRVDVRTLSSCLPRDIREARTFLVWKDEDDRKVPYYANGRRRRGANGSKEDRAYLVTLDHAIARYLRGAYDGIGLALLPELKIVALDFDNCRTSDGRLTGPVLACLGSTYAEVSPSGTGVRMLVRGSMSDSKSKQLEVFSTKGYVTLTGARLDNVEIADLTESLRTQLQMFAKRTVSVDFSPGAITEGARNNTLTSLAGSMRRRGMTRDAIEAALLIENERRCDPPLRDDEVQRIARSVERYPSNVLPKPPTMGTWSRATEVETDFDDWLVHEAIPLVGRAGVYGPSGEGKTAFAIDLVAHIALGRPWQGRDVEHRAKVAWIATEGATSVKRRFGAWSRYHRVDPKLLNREIFVFQGQLDLNSRESVNAFKSSIPALLALAEGTPPTVWLLETLATAMSGDENTKAIQDAAQAAYHAICETIGREPLVIFIHHTGKDEAREERGHSSLRALMDTSIKLEAGVPTGASPGKHEPSVVVKRGIATIRKQRDGLDGQQFAFELRSVIIGFDRKQRPRSQVVCCKHDDLDGAIAEARAKRSKTRADHFDIKSAIERAFDEYGDAEVPYASLLSRVADSLNKDPDKMIKNFSRALERAGFKTIRKGFPARSIIQRR